MATIYTEITAALVKRLPPTEAADLFIRDTVLTGFGIRIKPSGVASYFAEGWVKGVSRSRRVTLGKVEVLEVQKARAAAKTILSNAALGVDVVGEARAARHQEAEARAAEHREAEVKAVTLDKVFADFLEARALKPRTRKDYAKVRSAYLAGWKDRPITEITRADVLARHRELVAEVGPAQANMAFRVLRAVLRYSRAVYERPGGGPLLPDNPVAVLGDAKGWAAVRPRTNYIRPEDLRAWWKAVRAIRDGTVRDFLVVLLLTGRRRGEVEGLRWDDVSLAGRTLTFHDTKNGDDVIIPMGRHLSGLIAARAAARPKAADGSPTPWVFPARVGDGHLVEPMAGVRAVREATGLAWSPHDLRRGFLTYGDGLAGVSHYQLKALAGHRVQDVTGKHYVQTNPERLVGAMQAIETYILKAAKVRTPRPKPPAKVVPIGRARRRARG